MTSGPRASKRRRHPAQGARIAAAGLGATTLFGLVGAMALSRPPTSDQAPVPASPEQPVVVVVHHTGTSDPTADPGVRPATTRPSVRPAPPTSPAPAASTSGSH